MRRAALALIAALALAIAGCGGEDEETGEGTATTATTAGGCEQAEAPPPRQPEADLEKPEEPLDPQMEWSLVVTTNCGQFTIRLDTESAPEATASLVSLARAGFYDDTVFHRIAPGFVIQGGDPTATGGGGPGYTTVDRPPRGARYTKGVVAMAKTAREPAGAGGSQFFVVTGDDIGLPPDYAVVGRVSDGLDVVERIGRLGSQSQQPREPVVISDVEVATQRPPIGG